MHTHAKEGIHVDLAHKLEATFVWVPPLAAEVEHLEDYLTGPESIGLDKINAAFDEMEKENRATCDVDGAEVLEGKVYNFEMDRIDKGLTPYAFEEDITILCRSSSSASTWDVDAVMSSKGVSSL